MTDLAQRLDRIEDEVSEIRRLIATLTGYLDGGALTLRQLTIIDANDDERILLGTSPGDIGEAFVEVRGVSPRIDVPAPSVAMMTSTSAPEQAHAELVVSALEHNVIILGVNLDGHATAGSGIACVDLKMSDVVNNTRGGCATYMEESSAELNPARLRLADLELDGRVSQR